MKKLLLLSGFILGGTFIFQQVSAQNIHSTDTTTVVSKSVSSLFDRAFLGVQIRDDQSGARIEEVMSGSPADKAGLLKGDVITSIDKQKVENAESLSEAISRLQPDQEVTLTILRDNEKSSVKVVLGSAPADAFSTDTIPSVRDFGFRMPNPYEGRRGRPGFEMPRGFNFQNPRGFQPFLRHKAQMGIKIQDTEAGDGVKVLNVTAGSAADEAGVKEGDLIRKINDTEVNAVGDALREIRNDRGKDYTLEIIRNNKPMTLVVKIPKDLREADI